MLHQALLRNLLQHTVLWQEQSLSLLQHRVGSQVIVSLHTLHSTRVK